MVISGGFRIHWLDTNIAQGREIPKAAVLKLGVTNAVRVPVFMGMGISQQNFAEGWVLLAFWDCKQSYRVFIRKLQRLSWLVEVSTSVFSPAFCNHRCKSFRADTPAGCVSTHSSAFEVFGKCGCSISLISLGGFDMPYENRPGMRWERTKGPDLVLPAGTLSLQLRQSERFHKF